MTRLLVATLVLGALLVGCAQSGSGSTLTGNTWEWTASTTTTPASQSVVPVPQNYTIEFKSNQTFDGKADCNQISARGQAPQATASPSPSALHGRRLRTGLAR